MEPRDLFYKQKPQFCLLKTHLGLQWLLQLDKLLSFIRAQLQVPAR